MCDGRVDFDDAVRIISKLSGYLHSLNFGLQEVADSKITPHFALVKYCITLLPLLVHTILPGFVVSMTIFGQQQAFNLL